MTNLSDPAIREAGARALWLTDLGDNIAARAGVAAYWARTDGGFKAPYEARWDRIAAHIGPVIEQAEAWEQMRGVGEGGQK